MYLQKYSNHSQAVVSTHSLLKQTVLVRVPVDQVELQTYTDASRERFLGMGPENNAVSTINGSLVTSGGEIRDCTT